MMRLIDADAIAKEWSRYKPDIRFTMEDILIAIENRPTIEAAPVERDIPKKPTDQQLEEDGYGAWGSLYGHCPNCKGTVYDEQNYCEKCGQRLDWSREQGILQTTPNYSKRENGDPNGFNDETVQAMKDATERKNLSKVYDTLDDMYADMDSSEWREYIYRERETADGIDSDRMGELIRCKDCEWWKAEKQECYEWYDSPYAPADGYCFRAERRDDDHTR